MGVKVKGIYWLFFGGLSARVMGAGYEALEVFGGFFVEVETSG